MSREEEQHESVMGDGHESEVLVLHGQIEERRSIYKINVNITTMMKLGDTQTSYPQRTLEGMIIDATDMK